jgi:kynureninase
MGGVAALRAKSLALTDLFIALVQARCDVHGVDVVTPREHARRGSQVSLALRAGSPAAPHAYAIVQALIARGVIGDFRAGSPEERLPDILRFGFTPLYVGFADAFDAVEHLVQVLATEAFKEARFNQRAAVT